MSDPTRQCPFGGCGRMIRPDLFACPAHWARLTPAQKGRVWRCHADWQAGRITGDELRRLQRQVLDEAEGDPP